MIAEGHRNDLVKMVSEIKLISFVNNPTAVNNKGIRTFLFPIL